MRESLGSIPMLDATAARRRWELFRSYPSQSPVAGAIKSPTKPYLFRIGPRCIGPPLLRPLASSVAPATDALDSLRQPRPPFSSRRGLCAQGADLPPRDAAGGGCIGPRSARPSSSSTALDSLLAGPSLEEAHRSVAAEATARCAPSHHLVHRETRRVNAQQEVGERFPIFHTMTAGRTGHGLC